MDTKAVIARFESERQALALMNHPNIASVFDAGTTEQGRPYFAMELVHGEPITEYCDKNRLTIKERLYLFIQVCEGVQHAHQKGIIHRDIKPSNRKTGRVRLVHGMCLLELGRYEEAEAELVEAHRVLSAAIGETHPRTLEAARKLVDLYEQMGNLEKAAELVQVLLAERDRAASLRQIDTPLPPCSTEI